MRRIGEETWMARLSIRLSLSLATRNHHHVQHITEMVTMTTDRKAFMENEEIGFQFRRTRAKAAADAPTHSGADDVLAIGAGQ